MKLHIPTFILRINKHHVDKLKEHLVKLTLAIRVYYPAHEQRTESTTFRATRKQFINIENRGCWVCGTMEKREVHHFWCEWADANAIDWSATGAIRQLCPDFSWDNFKEPEDFVDSTHNCMVLCMKHHRRKNHGIHFMPYPLWLVQKTKLSTFVFTPK